MHAHALFVLIVVAPLSAFAALASQRNATPPADGPSVAPSVGVVEAHLRPNATTPVRRKVMEDQALIVDFGPDKVGPREFVADRTPVFVKFGQAMQQERDAIALELKPAVAGQWAWVDSHTYSFAPRERWTPGFKYEVHVHGEVEKHDGRTEVLDFSWSFVAEPPYVVLAVEGGMPGNLVEDEVLELEGSALTNFEIDELGSDEQTGCDGLCRAKYLKTHRPPSHLMATTGGLIRVFPSRGVDADTLQQHLHAVVWPVSGRYAQRKRVELIVDACGEDIYDDCEYRPRVPWPDDHYVEITLDADFSFRGSGPIRRPLLSVFRTTKNNRLSVTHIPVPQHDGESSIVVGSQWPLTIDAAKQFQIQPAPPGGVRLQFGEHIDVEKCGLDTSTKEEVENEGAPDLIAEETACLVNQLDFWGKYRVGQQYRVVVPSGTSDADGRPFVFAKRASVVAKRHRPILEIVAAYRAAVDRPEIAYHTVYNYSGLAQLTFASGHQPVIGLDGFAVKKAIVRVVALSDAQLARLSANAEMVKTLTDKAADEFEVELGASPLTGQFSYALDLSAHIGESDGAWLVQVEPQLSAKQRRSGLKLATKNVLVFRTALAAIAWPGAYQSAVHAFELTGLQPPANLQLSVLDEFGAVVHRSKMSAQGTGYFSLLQPWQLAVVEDGAGAKAYVNVDRHRREDGEIASSNRTDAPPLMHEFTTDRFVYRPGDVVSLVGYGLTKAVARTHRTDVALPHTKAVVQLQSFRGAAVLSHSVDVVHPGSYALQFELPRDIAPGSYELEVRVGEQRRRQEIRVGFVEPLPFQVSIHDDPSRDPTARKLRLSLRAADYLDRPIQIARSEVGVSCKVTAPIEREGWQGAVLSPDEDRGDLRHRTWRKTASKTPGRQDYFISLAGLSQDSAYECEVEATVEDETQAQASGAAIFRLENRRTLYSRVVRSNDRADVELLCLDAHQKPCSTPALEVVSFATFGQRKGARCPITLGESGKGTCHFRGKSSDAIAYVVGFAKDHPDPNSYDEERSKRGSGYFSYLRNQPISSVTSSTQRYFDDIMAVGDHHLLLPRTPQEIYAAFARGDDSVREIWHEAIAPGASNLQIRARVDDTWAPASLLTESRLSGQRGDPTSYFFTDDSTRIRIWLDHRQLDVAIDAPASVAAGEPLHAVVRAKYNDGQPARGVMSFWAVDQAMFDLYPLEFPEFVELIGRSLDDLGLIPRHSFRRISAAFFAHQPLLDETGLIGRGAGGGSGSGYSIAPLLGGKLREKDYNPTPIFLGNVALDGNGEARVQGNLGLAATRYRLVAIVASQGPDATMPGLRYFGHQVAHVEVRRAFDVVARAPKHLRPGDVAKGWISLQDYEGKTRQLSAAIDQRDGQAVIQLDVAARSQVRLDAHGQKVIPFTVTALAPGIATFEAAVHSLDEQGKLAAQAPAYVREFAVTVDAAPVATREVAVYGQHRGGEPFSVQVFPPRTQPTDTKVQVALDANPVGDLRVIASSLMAYPYRCLEQITSRLAALMVAPTQHEQMFRDVGGVHGYLQAAMRSLVSHQVSGGGYAYWAGSSVADPSASAYALHILKAVDGSGFPIHPSVIERLRTSVSRDLQRLFVSDARVRRAALRGVDRSLALAALAQWQESREQKVQLLAWLRRLAADAQEQGTASTASTALLALAASQLEPHGVTHRRLLAALKSSLRVQGRRASANCERRYFESQYAGCREANAWAMLALLTGRSTDDTVHKLVLSLRELDGNATTTQQALGLIALRSYQRKFGGENGPIAAQVWIDQTRVPSSQASATAGHEQIASARVLQMNEPVQTTIVPKQDDTTYYRVAMSWPLVADAAASGENAPGQAFGLALTRRLVTRGEHESLTHLSIGMPLALELEVQVVAQMQYVAIEVPIAGGLELVDDSIGQARHLQSIDKVLPAWVSHVERHADKLLVFADTLAPGNHELRVPIRAVRPGSYRMPTATVKAMYEPELQGFAAGTQVEIAQ